MYKRVRFCRDINYQGCIPIDRKAENFLGNKGTDCRFVKMKTE